MQGNITVPSGYGEKQVAFVSVHFLVVRIHLDIGEHFYSADRGIRWRFYKGPQLGNHS